ncbi:MAG: ATP-binding cassette domain-containing protein [Myxococcota bacterium]
MPLALELVGVAYAHLDSVPLLTSVDLRLSAGWTGLVGANGAGKTTLLRLIHGDLEPQAGEVRRPRRARSVFCPQRVDACDTAVQGFAVSDTPDAARLRGRLELDAAALAHWSRLSPGERKRWQVGAALAQAPDLLLLDEPTNHLDRPARDLLLDALARHAGIGLVVSHDRDLLERLTTATVRVARGSAVLYRGGYGEAQHTWQQEERQETKRAARLRRQRKQLGERLTAQRARRDHADARTRTSRRMKGPRDNATAGGLKMTRRRSAVNALGRDIHKLHGALERVDREASGIRLEKQRGRSLFVGYEAAPAGELSRVDLEGLEVGDGAEGRTLLRDVHLALWPTDRVWISGANGSGKSTLVGRLLATLRVPRERVLFLPQELDAAVGQELLDHARALPADARGRLLQIVAALGVDPDALLASHTPSPGEARKLALAEALSRRVWALLLDEPTNHLDLPSIERIERALADFPGALCIVTHDEAFAGRLTDTRWHLADGGIRSERP